MIHAGFIENCYIDFKKGVLVNRNVDAEKINMIACRYCGATMALVNGFIKDCESCGNPLKG